MVLVGLDATVFILFPKRPLVAPRTFMDFRIEQATPGDVPFLMSSWLKSYRRSPHTRKWSDFTYFARQRPLCEMLLARSQVLVARPLDWPEGIFGWIAFEKPSDGFVLHYGYVKSPYRRLGVARRLLEYAQPSGELRYSHHTMPGSSYLPSTFYHRRIYR